ncbi:uncharacterized protein LOC143034573 [Oratosquilla oratoria]|uniref:uncharacterized protein LOC143034573 n=1 Tax=Oratosquilla oratoria TaxID=337810 RepID=UPI003F77606A
MSVPKSELILPIISTDLSFFNDSAFEESRLHFEKAIKEIADRCKLNSKDYLSSYKSLRQEKLGADNQAVSVTDEDNARKIVIDVDDFKDGKMSVKVVDHSVVAEGFLDKTDLGSSSTHSFSRRFSLPKSVDLEAVTATITSDGILTITAPKHDELHITAEENKNEKDTSKSSGKSILKSSVTTIKKTESQIESHETSRQSSSNISQKIHTAKSSRWNTDKDSSNAERNSRGYIFKTYQYPHFHLVVQPRGPLYCLRIGSKITINIHTSTSWCSPEEFCIYKCSENDLGVLKKFHSLTEMNSQKWIYCALWFPAGGDLGFVFWYFAIAHVLRLAVLALLGCMTVFADGIPLKATTLSSTTMTDGSPSMKSLTSNTIYKEGITRCKHRHQLVVGDPEAVHDSPAYSLATLFKVQNLCHDTMKLLVATGGSSNTLGFPPNLTSQSQSHRPVQATKNNSFRMDEAKEKKGRGIPCKVLLFQRGSSRRSNATAEFEAVSSRFSTSGDALDQSVGGGLRRRFPFGYSGGVSENTLMSSLAGMYRVIGIGIDKNRHLFGEVASVSFGGEVGLHMAPCYPPPPPSREASEVTLTNRLTRVTSSYKAINYTVVGQPLQDTITPKAQVVGGRACLRKKNNLSCVFFLENHNKVEMSFMSDERSVAIKPTGLRFYQDSSEQTWKHFETAVKDITEKYGMTSADFWSSYRIIRLKELKQENQAVAITDENNIRKITMDVRDFKTPDLSVTTGGHGVEVEGRVERHDGGSLSTHCFRRRFALPEAADVTAASAVVSTDGVLTVTVPKMKSPEAPSNEERPLFRNLSPGFAHPTVTPKRSSGVLESFMEENREADIVTRSIDYQSSNTHSADMTSPDGSVPDPLDRSSDMQGETTLPVMLRGSFFDDEFFRHAHSDFQEAVEKILKKHDIGTTTPERMKKYRYLREDNLSDETQAVTISEDDSCQKIVLDAHDFKDGDLKVKRVGRCLVVEGRVQKASGGSSSTHSFLRRFAMPSHANLDDVTAALSLDGVLTIVVKKHRATPMPAYKTSPLLVEEEPHPPANVNTSSETRTSEEIRPTSPRTWGVEQRTPVSAMRSERKVSFNAEVQENEIPSKRRKVDDDVEEMEDEDEPEIIEEESDDDIQEIKETKTTTSRLQTRPESEEATPTSTRAKESSRHFQRRGNLFQSSLLPEDQNKFQSAATKVLEKFGMKSPSSDDGKSPRVADRSSTMEQIQATQITDDGKTYTVTLDVSEFVVGEVEVKTEGQMLVIEGLSKKREGNSTCRQGFRRCFTVPSSVALEFVSSDLSSEGLLTITAPKKEQVSICEEDTSGDDKESTDSSFHKTEVRGSSSSKFEAKLSSPFMTETRLSSPFTSKNEFSSLIRQKTSTPIITERKITSIQKEEVRISSPCREVIRLPSPPKEVTTVSSSHKETRVSSPEESTKVSSKQSEETKISSVQGEETKVSAPHMEETDASSLVEEVTVSSAHEEETKVVSPVKKTKVSSKKKVVKKSNLQKEKSKASSPKKSKTKVSATKKEKTTKVSTPKKKKTTKISTPKKIHHSHPVHHTPSNLSDGVLTRSTCKASPGGRCCCKELTFGGES